MFGFGSRRRIENAMAEWLAHPNEFGMRPKDIRLKRTYNVNVMTHGDRDLHLLEYTMPDGTTGRGFVNGALTWSFLGDEVNAISYDDLLVAYCGWAWLFPLENLEFTDRYKIGTSELFEFKATKNGRRIKGAGDTESEVSYDQDDPRFNLPSIYFFLGRACIKSIR